LLARVAGYFSYHASAAVQAPLSSFNNPFLFFLEIELNTIANHTSPAPPHSNIPESLIIIPIMDIKPGNSQVVESSSTEEGGFELRNYSQLGGTEADERDMQMLGRTQQLNVCRSTMPILIENTHL
jgi:hypothetical protein